MSPNGLARASLVHTPGGGVRFLHLTDTHLFARPDSQLLGVNTADSLDAVWDGVMASQEGFEQIIVTGDIAQDHSIAAYQRFATKMMASSHPVYWLPGNHDDIPVLKATLYGAHISEAKHLIGEHWHIILLDSQLWHQPGGRLSDHQLQQLALALEAYPHLHALVALHHPIAPVGCAWLDAHQLANASDMMALLRLYPRAKTILCGHVHQAVDCSYADLRLLATPSTCIQFLPHSAEFTLDEQSPGWRMVELLPDGQIVTAVKRLAPHSFCGARDATGY